MEDNIYNEMPDLDSYTLTLERILEETYERCRKAEEQAQKHFLSFRAERERMRGIINKRNNTIQQLRIELGLLKQGDNH